jgi:hypothetical protein
MHSKEEEGEEGGGDEQPLSLSLSKTKDLKQETRVSDDSTFFFGELSSA